MRAHVGVADSFPKIAKMSLDEQVDGPSKVLLETSGRFCVGRDTEFELIVMIMT